MHDLTAHGYGSNRSNTIKLTDNIKTGPSQIGQTEQNRKDSGKDYIGYCIKCGSPIPKGVKFCSECGAKVPGQLLNSIAPAEENKNQDSGIEQLNQPANDSDAEKGLQSYDEWIESEVKKPMGEVMSLLKDDVPIIGVSK